MKKIHSIGLLVLAIAFMTSCGGSGGGSTPAPEKTVAELIGGKIWSANIVTESGTEVYNKSKTTNTKDGYKNFKLDLTSTSAAKLIEVDGNTYAGSYTFTASGTTGTLTFNGLNPAPTNTNGTISYTVTKKSDTNLVFTRTTASTKTGGTNNVYDMVNP